jgi:uncharacterized NAD-dependent epimerase/dehydratase family protein
MVEVKRDNLLDQTAPPTTTTGTPLIANQQPVIKPTDSTLIHPSQGKVVHQTDAGTVVGVGLPSSTTSTPIIPSNVQIDASLDKAKSSLESVTPQLTQQGRRIAYDTEQVIDSAQRLLHNKNQDEKLQRMVREATLASKETAVQGTMVGQNIRGDQYQTTGLAKDTLSNARDVVMFLVRHPEFRSFWLELIALLRSVLQDVNSRYGSELKQSVKQDSRQATDVAKSQINQAVNQQQYGTSGFQEPLSTGYQQPLLTGTGYSPSLTEPLLPSSQQTWGTTSGIQQPVTTGATKQVLGDIAQDIRQGELGDQQLWQNIQMRFDQMLLTLSQHPQYNQAISNLFMIFDAFRDRMDRVRADPNYTVTGSGHYQQVMADAWNLLAEFTGRDLLQNFENVMWQIYSDLRNDQLAIQFMKSVKDYIQFSIQSPNALTDDYRKQQGRMLLDQARTVFNIEQSRHQDSFNLLFNYATGILNAIKNDSDTQALTQSVGRLAKDMMFDEQGRPDLFLAQESMDQLRRMVVPLLQKQLQRVPLPMIEASTDKYDYRIENMVMNGTDILPDFFDLKLVNNFSMGSKQTGERAFAKLKLRANNMRVMFNDMSYFYRRKKMPKLEDHGIADVGILGSGLNIKITWRLYSKNNVISLELTRVKVFIDKLDIKVKQSQHKLINKLALKIFGGAIKRRVSAAIVEKIRDTLNPINNQLNDFFRREREGHNLRERANVKMQELYMNQGTSTTTGTGIGQRIKETVSNVVGSGMNVAKSTDPNQMQTSGMTSGINQTGIPSTGYTTSTGDYMNVNTSDSFNLTSFSHNLPSTSSTALPTTPTSSGMMKEKDGRWTSSWVYEPTWNSGASDVNLPTHSVGTTTIGSPTSSQSITGSENTSLTSSTL